MTKVSTKVFALMHYYSSYSRCNLRDLLCIMIQIGFLGT